jgi:hypothetical protein
MYHNLAMCMNVKSSAPSKHGRRYTYPLAHHLEMNRGKATGFSLAALTFRLNVDLAQQRKRYAYHSSIIDGGL